MTDRPRVLVVDDDPTVLRSISTALGRAGYHVITASEAVPAMALDDRFDAVIVDYNMVTGTGAEVVKHFKGRHGAAVYCVVLSGDDDAHANARCREAGADTILTKPALPAVLRQCLESGLAAAA